MSKCQEEMIVQQETYSITLSPKLLKIIDIDLSRQINTTILQQINFIGKLKENNYVTIFFLPEKEQKTNGIIE